MIDLMDRHSSWGKPFQTLCNTTKKYGSVAVHANRTTRTSPGHPSQLSEQIDYPGPPIPIIRLEQGQSGTTRPKRQLYTQCTVGQKANAEHQHMSGDMITPIWRSAARSAWSKQDKKKYALTANSLVSPNHCDIQLVPSNSDLILTWLIK